MLISPALSPKEWLAPPGIQRRPKLTKDYPMSTMGPCLVRSLLFTAALLGATPALARAPASQDVLRLDYEGFTVWLDCARRGAVKFRYNAQRDQGEYKRVSRFHSDPKAPAHCQQTSTGSYRAKGRRYDRGHLVPANHLDHSALAIRQSNTMTNVLPQAANMNRGAWLATEELIECYRDIDELLVIGGVIWGENPEDDYFRHSHGVATPDAFWKVVIRDERALAWLVPNSQAATRKRADSYLVSLAELERVTGEQFPVPDYLKAEQPKSAWVTPIGCNRS
jgi:endonuclease G